MTTALEAMEAATATPDPAITAPPAEAAKPAVDTEALARELDAVNTGEVEELRKQNRDLLLRQFPEEMRPGINRVLEVHQEAQYVKTERAKLDTEKMGLARDRVLGGYKEFGVTEAHLKHCPDEAAMKEMAESIKALKVVAETDTNPDISKEKPNTANPGGAPAPDLRGRYKRRGLEAGMTGLIGDLMSGGAQ